MRRSKKVLNQHGVTLIEILIGTSLLAFIVVAALSVDRISKRADSRLNVVRTLETIRGNLIEILTDHEGLRKTIEASSVAGGDHAIDRTMDCLKKSIERKRTGFCNYTDYDQDGGEPPFEDGPYYSTTQQFWKFNWSLRPFVVKRSNDTVFYDGRVLAEGFTMDGNNCSNFEYNGLGNPACPLRMELSWTIECDQQACECPVLVVAGRALFHGGAASTGLDSASIHPQQHGITALRLPLDPWCGFTPTTVAPTPMPTPSTGTPAYVRPDDPECATGTVDPNSTCGLRGCVCNGTYLDCPAAVATACAATGTIVWTPASAATRPANGDAFGTLTWGPSDQCCPPRGKLPLGPACNTATSSYTWNYGLVLPQMSGLTTPALTAPCCPECQPFVCPLFRAGGSIECCDKPNGVTDCCTTVPQNRTWDGTACGCTPSRPCPT
jgi:hypothetical protein